MVTLTLSNVKDFMNRLLLTPTFDDWGFQGAEVIALTQYSIAGALNSRYLSEAERASRKTEGLLFSEVRKVLASIIKAGPHSFPDENGTGLSSFSSGRSYFHRCGILFDDDPFSRWSFKSHRGDIHASLLHGSQ